MPLACPRPRKTALLAHNSGGNLLATVAMSDLGPFTEPQAARILGVHPNTLARWRRQGAIGHTLTPGNRVRYAAEDLARLRVAMHVAPVLGGK